MAEAYQQARTQHVASRLRVLHATEANRNTRENFNLSEFLRAKVRRIKLRESVLVKLDGIIKRLRLDPPCDIIVGFNDPRHEAIWEGIVMMLVQMESLHQTEMELGTMVMEFGVDDFNCGNQLYLPSQWSTPILFNNGLNNRPDTGFDVLLACDERWAAKGLDWRDGVYTWKVRFEQRTNGHPGYKLTDGWAGFFRDHHLAIRDTLMFQVLGSLNTCCWRVYINRSYDCETLEYKATKMPPSAAAPTGPPVFGHWTMQLPTKDRPSVTAARILVNPITGGLDNALARQVSLTRKHTRRPPPYGGLQFIEKLRKEAHARGEVTEEEIEEVTEEVEVYDEKKEEEASAQTLESNAVNASAEPSAGEESEGAEDEATHAHAKSGPSTPAPASAAGTSSAKRKATAPAAKQPAPKKVVVPKRHRVDFIAEMAVGSDGESWFLVFWLDCDCDEASWEPWSSFAAPVHPGQCAWATKTLPHNCRVGRERWLHNMVSGSREQFLHTEVLVRQGFQDRVGPYWERPPVP